MKTKVILFDLDGTLLPMDQNVFVKAYFGGIAKRLAPRGYEPNALIDGIWKGTGAMIKNDGKRLMRKSFGISSPLRSAKKRAQTCPILNSFMSKISTKCKRPAGLLPKPRRRLRR